MGSACRTQGRRGATCRGHFFARPARRPFTSSSVKVNAPATCRSFTDPAPPATALHASMTDHCQPPSRRVSFIVPDNQRVGGFGDRLLGLVTTMYVAVMTSSGLVVNWTVPYDLRQYFHVLDCANVQAGGSRRRGQRNAERVPFPRPVNTTHNERAIDAWSYFQNGTFLNEISRDVDLITNARHWLNVVQTPGLEDMAHHLGVASLSRQQLFKLVKAQAKCLGSSADGARKDGSGIATAGQQRWWGRASLLCGRPDTVRVARKFGMVRRDPPQLGRRAMFCR